MFSFKEYFKKMFCLLILVSVSAVLSAQETQNFEKGKDYFLQNEPLKALSYLKKACSEGVSDAYLYLAVSYYQLGKYRESIEICSDGMNAFGTDKKVLAFNAGNSAFCMKNYAGAEEWYTLSIKADDFYGAAFLNRANSRFNQKKYEEAIEDYEQYLMLEPENPQKIQIQQLIDLLREQIEADALAEAERIEKERMLREEAERIAAEEAERKRRLLEAVADQLQNLDSENVSFGAEDTFDYDFEGEME